MSEGRTTNTIKNAKTGFIVQIINKIMAFVVRTIFIKTLGTEYLGLNGLFTNVLTILSLAELGIGTAIIFSMYKPISNKEYEKIKGLMSLYRKSYNTIGITVFGLGLLIMPFIPYLTRDLNSVKESFFVIYLLYLINTSSSYFFTYKRSIIIAHQKQSLINTIDSLYYIIKSLFEIVILLVTKNFVLYLLLQIGSTVVENIIISIIANKMYPYLKERNIEKIDNKEKKIIFSNVKSLIVYQFGSVIMNGTDNIIISGMIGTNMVGLCSNYTMIINSLKSIVLMTLNSVTASVGNLNVISNLPKKESILYQITLVDYIVFSFCTIALIILLDPFINIWLGKSFVLNVFISMSLAISFFIEGIRQPVYIYRTTLGLFSKGKYTPYIGAITNIILSIILCYMFGVVGVFIATSISQLVSYSWMDPFIIYKYEFKKSPLDYYKRIGLYCLLFIIELCISLILVKLIKFNNIFFDFCYRSVIALIIPNLCNYICLYKTYDFIEVKQKVLNKKERIII